jgi:glycine/sarcosine N-methyltransferase
MMPVPLYDALAVDYDRFVNWEGRLAHELPFFDGLFKDRETENVLDAACGTGYHAIALARRGYQVTGTDLSAPMIQRARENASRAGVHATFAVAGLGQMASLGTAFDAAICLGNSLPHLLTREALAAALADFAQVLVPGGLLVIQNRNFDRVLAERQRFLDPQLHREEGREWLFVRFYDFHEETITFTMIRLQRTKEGWSQQVNSTELRPILRDDLVASLSATGFEAITFYGGYDRAAFDRKRSGDLIAVARRAA